MRPNPHISKDVRLEGLPNLRDHRLERILGWRKMLSGPIPLPAVHQEKTEAK